MAAKEGDHTDGSSVKDSIKVELNGEVVQGTSTLPSVGDKPAESAKKSSWEEYAVALGLDPNTAADWDKDALIEWCG